MGLSNASLLTVSDGMPFDIDVFDRVTEHIATKSISKPFTVR